MIEKECKDTVFEDWITSLKKTGPTESSVLFVTYKGDYEKNHYRIMGLLEQYYNQMAEESAIIFQNGALPEGRIEKGLTVIIKDYNKKFTNEMGNILFTNCKFNVIIFIQEEETMKNFDTEFLENYGTVFLL